MPNPWFPTVLAQKVLWMNNFSVKFATYGPTVGFTAAEVTAVANDAAMFAYAVNLAETFKFEAQERTQYRDILLNGPLGTPAPATPTVPALAPPATIPPPGIIPRLLALVQRIKNHPNYTKAMGEDLGIEPPAAASTPAVVPAPEFRLIALPGGRVSIEWVKAGQDGVVIQRQRAGETGWTTIGSDLRSPFEDAAPNLVPNTPENRRYRLAYFDGDPSNLLSDWSAVQSVTL